MKKQDNLEVSFGRALKGLAKKDIQRQCQLAGADYKVIRPAEVLISLLLMERVYQIRYPEGEVVCRDNSRPVNLLEKAILLRYLNNAREAGGGEKLEWAAKRLGGTAIPFGDVGMRISFLPKVKISFIIWEGDDEFSPQGKILFNSHIASYLSTEGIVIASAMTFNELKKELL